MPVKRILLVVLCMALVSCATTHVKDKKQAEAHFKLGVSQLEGGNIQPAYVEFQKALKFDNKNKQVHNALGTVYLQLEDLQSAEGEFQTAGRLDSKYSEAFNNLCYVDYVMKKYDDAIVNCKKAISNPIYETPEKSYYNLGRTYYRMGKYDDAIHNYTEAIKRMPVLHLAYYGLALSYNRKGEYGKAAEAMGRAITLDPRFNGDTDKAEQAFSRADAMGDDIKDIQDYLEILKY